MAFEVVVAIAAVVLALAVAFALHFAVAGVVVFAAVDHVPGGAAALSESARAPMLALPPSNATGGIHATLSLRNERLRTGCEPQQEERRLKSDARSL